MPLASTVGMARGGLAHAIGLAEQIGCLRSLDAQVVTPEVDQRPARLIPRRRLDYACDVERVVAARDDLLDVAADIRDRRFEDGQATLTEFIRRVAERRSRQFGWRAREAVGQRLRPLAEDVDRETARPGDDRMDRTLLADRHEDERRIERHSGER